MKHSTRIKIFRDEHHFAAAHFLVEMGKCERLHGHNYGVTVEICADPAMNHTVTDFNRINPLIKRVCDTLDHKILIAGEDPRQTLTITGEELEARFGPKRFVFPKSDCEVLPVKATTVELLSAYLSEKLLEALRPLGLEGLQWLEVGVKEGGSQMAIHRMEF
ncbi:MAG: 6-carboxytetrahydropterin synthase [Nitrospinae bacterium]|nr:6-carboxytetrahydropterin synthase [Nitrospinota bacterium]